MSMLHARAAAIEALPSRAVTASELELAQAAVEAVECSICLADLAVGDTLTRLPCGHEFHGRCIRKWLWALSMPRVLCKTAVAPSLPPVATSANARALLLPLLLLLHLHHRTSTTAAPVSTATTTPTPPPPPDDAAIVAADAATVAVAVGSLAAQSRMGTRMDSVLHARPDYSAKVFFHGFSNFAICTILINLIFTSIRVNIISHHALLTRTIGWIKTRAVFGGRGGCL